MTCGLADWSIIGASSAYLEKYHQGPYDRGRKALVMVSNINEMPTGSQHGGESAWRHQNPRYRDPGDEILRTAGEVASEAVQFHKRLPDATVFHVTGYR